MNLMGTFEEQEIAMIWQREAMLANPTMDFSSSFENILRDICAGRCKQQYEDAVRKLRAEKEKMRAEKEKKEKEEANPARFFDTQNWRDEVDESVDWLFDGAIQAGKVNMIYGEGGVGKSTFTRVLALSALLGRTLIPSFAFANGVDAGEPDECYEAEGKWDPYFRKDVIMLSAEGDAGTVLRSMEDIAYLHNVKESHFDAATDAGLYLIAGRSECFLVPCDGSWDWSEFLHKVFNKAMELDSPLVIVDPLCKFYTGSENENELANRFMRACEEFTEKSLSTMILVHHPDKKSGLPRGAGSFRNSSRSAWFMAKTGKGSVKLSHNKCNEGEEQPPFELIFDGPALREKGLDGAAVGPGIVEWITQNPDCALTLGGLNQGLGAAARALLASLKEGQPDLSKKDVHQGAVAALASGLLFEVSVKNRNGKTSKHLKVKEPAQ